MATAWSAIRLVFRGARLLDAAAEDWLGLALPPAEQVLGRSGFRPDEPVAYCHRCGDSIGPGEAGEDGCGSCRGSPRLADAVVRLGPYIEPLRQWLLAVKYEQRWREMADLLGRLLGGAVLDQAVIEPARAVVVPMPMPWARRLHRGIDHARAIARGTAAELHAPLLNVLAKANGLPQVALSLSERQRRGSQGMRLRRRAGGWSLDGCDVLLVDDVRTTGSSLRTATRVLRSTGPRRIVAAVVAVADSPARRSPA
jgi:predicted amidophosphoribosyltransferase